VLGANPLEVNRKVIAYITSAAPIIETAGSKKFQIFKTKGESALYRCKDVNSSISKLCKIAQENAYVRSLFFLENECLELPFYDYPLQVRFPIIFSISDSFQKMQVSPSTKELIESRKGMGKKVGEDYRSIGMSSAALMTRALLQDTEYRQKARRGAIPINDKEYLSLVDRALSRHKDLFEKLAQDFIDFSVTYTDFVTRTAPLLQAFENLEKAKLNLEKLNPIIAREGIDNFGTSLSQLSNIFRISVDSICLECQVCKGYPEATHIEQVHVGKPDFKLRCEKCSGETMYHNLFLEAENYFAPLIKENIVQELIIGHCIAKIPQIKKVYLHKKVGVLTEQGPEESKQIDILALTNDDKVIVVEVTTLSDWTNIITRERTKEKIFEDFPYDYLFYVTGGMDGRYIPYDDIRTYVLNVSHIPNIDEIISKFLEGKPPHKPS
jgi:hypothetical protein